MAPKPHTPLPITLERRRIYVFPTGHGFVFLAVMLAMLIGSVNYNNNLGFLLVFLLGAMTLVSILHTYRNLSGLHILSVSAEPVFAGRDAVFCVQVRSGAHSRRGVSFFLKRRRNVVIDIDAHTTENVEISAAAAPRGVLRPDALRISSRYPMGLFRAWTVLRPEMWCLVYPIPLEGPLLPVNGSGSDGEGAKHSERGVDDFNGLRPYQPGDPIQHISWKTLSRGQGVFTKDFAGHASRQAVFDFERLEDADPEMRLSRLCHMVLEADRLQLDYGLALPGNKIAPGRGAAHKRHCLKTLAIYGTTA